MCSTDSQNKWRLEWIFTFYYRRRGLQLELDRRLSAFLRLLRCCPASKNKFSPANPNAALSYWLDDMPATILTRSFSSRLLRRDPLAPCFHDRSSKILMRRENEAHTRSDRPYLRSSRDTRDGSKRVRNVYAILRRHSLRRPSSNSGKCSAHPQCRPTIAAYIDANVELTIKVSSTYRSACQDVLGLPGQGPAETRSIAERDRDSLCKRWRRAQRQNAHDPVHKQEAKLGFS